MQTVIDDFWGLKSFGFPDDNKKQQLHKFNQLQWSYLEGLFYVMVN
jgi:hypothetical protein